MENLKVISLYFVALLIVGALGYWAYSSIDSGSEYAKKSEFKQLAREKEAEQKEAEELSRMEREEADRIAKEELEKKSEVPEPAPVLKHQVLINELEELIKDNINMKLKSKGTRVGTVQNFLNIYNKTTNKVDNVYGESTKKAVGVFQKSVGLKVDGLAGPTTYQKMIDWLKQQG